MKKPITLLLSLLLSFFSFSVNYVTVTDECPLIRFTEANLKDIVADKTDIKLSENASTVSVNIIGGGNQAIYWNATQARAYGYSLDSLYNHILDILKVTCTGGGGGGTVESVVAGTNVTVTGTSTNPIVNSILAYSVTYAQALAAISGSLLKTNALYLITDHAEIYNQSVTNITKTATTEPLVLRAISNNKFSPIAQSTDFPNDIIHYDITVDTTFVNAAPAKGKITWRESPTGIKMGYDWRHVLMYDVGAAAGSLTFDLSNNVFESDFKYGFTPLNSEEFPNSIFKGDVYENTANVCAYSIFNGEVTFNASNQLNNSTFSGAVTQVANCQVSECTFDDWFIVSTTCILENSTFHGKVSKICNGSNFLNTTVGGLADRLDGFVSLNNTFGARLYWSSSVNAEYDTIQGDVEGLNTINIHHTRIDSCAVVNIQGITHNSDYCGFTNCHIKGSVFPGDYFGNIRVTCRVYEKTITKALYPELFILNYEKTIYMKPNGEIWYTWFNDSNVQQFKQIL